MARRRPVSEVDDAEQLLLLAGTRLNGVANLADAVSWKYLEETDLLTIRFKDNPHPNRSTGDVARGIIFNYEGRTLVSIEILDIYGVFVP